MTKELIEGTFPCGHPRTPENTAPAYDKKRPNRAGRCSTCKKEKKRKYTRSATPEQKKKTNEASQRARRKNAERLASLQLEIEALAHDLTRSMEIANYYVNENARLSDTVERAAALVAKLDECQPYIDSAFFQMANHGMPHTGPQYGEELHALRSALAAHQEHSHEQ